MKDVARDIIREQRRFKRLDDSAAAVKEDDLICAAFGTGETTGNQGCLILTDAQLLLLPARSLAGTFVWTTSCLALARLHRVLQILQSGYGRGNCATIDDGIGLLSAVLGSNLPVDDGTTAAAAGAKDVVGIERGDRYVIEGLVLNGTTLSSTSEPLGKLATWISERLFPDAELVWRAYSSRGWSLATMSSAT